jgi:hypothetical protein
MRFFTFTLLTAEAAVPILTRGASPAITFTCTNAELFLTATADDETDLSEMVTIMADILPIDVSFTEDKDIVASPDDFIVKGHVPRNTSPSPDFHLLSNTAFDTVPPLLNEDTYVSDNPTQVHSKLKFDVSSSSVIELLSAATSGS